MKFMVEYKSRLAGLTAEQSMANGQSLLTAFSKWKPDEGMKIHAFVERLSGAGGYALVEADDPKIIHAFAAKFIYWVDSEVIPVTEVGAAVASAHEALAWAQGAMKG